MSKIINFTATLSDGSVVTRSSGTMDYKFVIEGTTTDANNHPAGVVGVLQWSQTEAAATKAVQSFSGGKRYAGLYTNVHLVPVTVAEKPVKAAKVPSLTARPAKPTTLMGVVVKPSPAKKATPAAKPAKKATPAKKVAEVKAPAAKTVTMDDGTVAMVATLTNHPDARNTLSVPAAGYRVMFRDVSEGFLARRGFDQVSAWVQAPGDRRTTCLVVAREGGRTMEAERAAKTAAAKAARAEAAAAAKAAKAATKAADVDVAAIGRVIVQARLADPEFDYTDDLVKLTPAQANELIDYLADNTQG